jgi:GxxExxY protein
LGKAEEKTDRLTEKVIGAAIEVHRVLGPGLLESTYRACLLHELTSRGITALAEVPLPVMYKGLALECGYRIDLLVEDTLLVELKSVEQTMPIHSAQILTYLKHSGRKTGLLLNFNVVLLHQGLKRFVL